jgi:hypothetical protein
MAFKLRKGDSRAAEGNRESELVSESARAFAVETPRMAALVEKVTGLVFASPPAPGCIKFAPAAELEEMALEGRLTQSGIRLGADASWLARKLVSILVTGLAVYSPNEETVYVRTESFVKSVERYSVPFVSAGLAKGEISGRFTREADGEGLASSARIMRAVISGHELGHRIFIDNAAGRKELSDRVRGAVESMAAGSASAGGSRLEEFRGLVKTAQLLRTVDEGAATYIGKKAFSEAEFPFERLKEALKGERGAGELAAAVFGTAKNSPYRRGEKFFLELESLTGENPVRFVCLHGMPVSEMEIDSPSLYLGRVRGRGSG